jgi:hypothetical protein
VSEGRRGCWPTLTSFLTCRFWVHRAPLVFRTICPGAPNGPRPYRYGPQKGGNIPTTIATKDPRRAPDLARSPSRQSDHLPARGDAQGGADVVATVRLGPVFVVAPCRVVYVTDSPGRFGFAYGTLPGHPERGEEAFHVIRSEDGTVAFEIVAFSRPASTMARLGGPLSRMVQSRTTRRFLDGVLKYAAG